MADESYAVATRYSREYPAEVLERDFTEYLNRLADERYGPGRWRRLGIRYYVLSEEDAALFRSRVRVHYPDFDPDDEYEFWQAFALTEEFAPQEGP